MKKKLIALLGAAILGLAALLAAGAAVNLHCPWWMPYPLMTAAVVVTWCGGLMEVAWWKDENPSLRFRPPLPAATATIHVMAALISRFSWRTRTASIT